MANSLYNQIMGNNTPMNNGLQQIKSIKNMADSLKNSSNPMGMLKIMAQQNPQLSQVLNCLNGQSPKEAFMNLAKQKGIDPNQIINSLK